MPLFSRHGDPFVQQVARDMHALFPHCQRCGLHIEHYEDADVRVLVQRVVHRGSCPAPDLPDAMPATPRPTS